MSNRIILSIIGFLLMGFGALSLILGTLGLSLTPILFIDKIGNPLGIFLVKLSMLLVGFILFYFGRMDPEMEE